MQLAQASIPLLGFSARTQTASGALSRTAENQESSVQVTAIFTDVSFDDYLAKNLVSIDAHGSTHPRPIRLLLSPSVLVKSCDSVRSSDSTHVVHIEYVDTLVHVQWSRR